MLRFPEGLTRRLKEIIALPDVIYGQLKLVASDLLKAMGKPLHEQQSEVRTRRNATLRLMPLSPRRHSQGRVGERLRR